MLHSFFNEFGALLPKEHYVSLISFAQVQRQSLGNVQDQLCMCSELNYICFGHMTPSKDYSLHWKVWVIANFHPYQGSLNCLAGELQCLSDAMSEDRRKKQLIFINKHFLYRKKKCKQPPPARTDTGNKSFVHYGHNPE